jgi:HD domain
MNPKKLAKPEVVVELLAEGGSLTLMVADVIEWEDSSRPSGKFGTIQRYPDLIEEKLWMSERVFWVVRDERTLLALFDKEDLPAIDFYAKTEFREDFYVTLREFMDPYQWWLLYPKKILEDFEDCFEDELSERFPGWIDHPETYADKWYNCQAWHTRIVQPITRRDCYGKAMDKALFFVADAFRNKTRKGTTIPYLTHLLAVTALVGEFGGNEDQLIAALLHDSLEDLEWVTIDYLKEHYGAEVTEIVMALSDTTEHPKPEWRTRKTRYLERLAEEGPLVKLVSAADKLHNIQCLIRDLRTHGDEVWKRFNAGREDQVWYYQAALEALGRGWKDPLLGEFREAVGRLESLQEGV